MNNSINNPAILSILVADEQRQVSVDKSMLDDALPLFDKMDQDMDNGWQLGRQYVMTLNTLQRCQVAANRLLTALHTGNEASMTLMAGYILTRLPEVKTASINTEGEADETLFYDHSDTLIS
ncbi:MAG: hypothetical protein ACR2QW_19500 [bacterium]